MLGKQHEVEPTASYLFASEFKRFSEEVRDSLERLNDCAAQEFRYNPTFNLQSETIFKAMLNLDDTEDRLVPQAINDTYQNNRERFFIQDSITNPFLEKVPSNALILKNIVNEVSNGTAQRGDIFEWVGGKAIVFESSNSLVYAIANTCYKYKVRSANGSIVLDDMVAFVRQRPPAQSLLFRITPSSGPVLCGGSGLVFREHGDLSQRVWFNHLTSDRREIVGPISPADLGQSSLVSLSDEQLKELNRLDDGDAGVSGFGNILTRFDDTGEEYELTLKSYNNVGFLILSVAAVLASTAVALLTPSDAKWDEGVVIAVEGVVVYCFLAILSHICVVYLRQETFLIDSQDVIYSRYTYNDLILEAESRILFTAVGERTQFPVQLILAEIFVVIAAVVVTTTIIRLAVNVRNKKIREHGERRTGEEDSDFEDSRKDV